MPVNNKIHPLHDPVFILDYMHTTGEYFPQERGTGRTECLALEAIISALRNPHQWVVTKDHHKTTPANRELLQRCRKVVAALGYKHFTFREDALCFGNPPIFPGRPLSCLG